MKKAIIDLDDVLALDGFLNMMNDFNNSNYTYEEIKGYYVEEVLSKEKLIQFRSFFKENNVYDYATVAPNSKEILMNLMLEYEIYIASSYYSSLDHIIMPDLISKKCEFLLKNYPFLTCKNFIFINDKNMLNADIRIDDKISNLSGNGIKLLYSAYHNKDIDDDTLISKGITRVNSWNDIDIKLLKKTIYK
jgi:5'(3')-deoxyribonucleotidase